MRNYKIMISSKRKSFLVDLKSNIYYFLNLVGNNPYFAKDNEFRTVEEGLWYYLDGTYILCSEDIIPYIYK